MKQQNSRRVVGVTGARIDDVAAIADRFATGRYIPPAAETAGDPLVEETIRAVGGTGAVDDPYTEAAAALLTIHLLTRDTRLPADYTPAQENPRVRAAIAMMRERLALSAAAARFGEVSLSVNHLVRAFEEATGVNPHRYLMRLRIDEAKRLFRETDLTVAQIAGRCGFSDPGALSDAFARHAGEHSGGRE
ncbi:AraC family transcriptional regulator [Nocardia mexicana]|uniref:Helix-turn-helix protein n=1 Tax=Nocardia mexicana TaxID=279262 RepID=A0A370HEY1_9NOCA|nr:AraC family transcriptional regulator [Nocardia mexicana]RDI55336.1 helix-turn-helix protein [Nocardia mexicana]